MKPSIKEIYTRLYAGETIKCSWNGIDAVMQYDNNKCAFTVRQSGCTTIWDMLAQPVYEQVSFNPAYTEVCSILLTGERRYGTCAAGTKVYLYFKDGTFYIKYKDTGVIGKLTPFVYNQIRLNNTREFTLDSVGNISPRIYKSA
jgi:hypothetical protein